VVAPGLGAPMLGDAAAPGIAHAQERTVTLWHAYTGAEEAGIRAAALRFAEAHPGTRVEVLGVAFGAYGSKFESAIVSGNGPDVFIEAHERLQTYVAGGYVEAYAPSGSLSSALSSEYE